MTTAATARFRYIGITDESTVCDNCGKSELRSTVIIMPVDAEGNDEGELCYYGSTCAARALGVSGGGRAVRQAATWQHHATLDNAADARRMLAHYGLPQAGDATPEQISAAMRLYVQAHPNIARHVAETGMGVRARVADMLARKQAALREAALVDARCSYCDTRHGLKSAS